jgi:hypothetical protein
MARSSAKYSALSVSFVFLTFAGTTPALAKKIEFSCAPDAGSFSNWETAEISRPVKITGMIDVERLDKSDGNIPTANIRLIDGRGKSAALLRLAVFDRAPNQITSMVEFTEGRDTVQHQLVPLPLDAKNVNFSLSYQGPDTLVAVINGKKASISGLPLRIAKVGLTCASGAFTFRDVEMSAN